MNKDLLKNLKSSFLIKLIITYSGIIIFILLILLFFLKTNLTGIVQKQQISFEKQIVDRVSEYFDSSLTSAKEIVQRIYLSDSGTRVRIFNFLESNGGLMSFDNSSDRSNFDRLFSSQLANNNNILDIIIYKASTKDVVSYTKDNRKIDNEYDYFKYPWAKKIFEEGQILKVIPTYIPNYVTNDSRYIYSAAASIFETVKYKTTGEIIINLDANKIESAYSNYKKDIKGYILVMDKLGNIIFDSSKKFYGKKYPYFDKLKSGNEYITLDQKCMVNLNRVSNDDFIVAGVVPKEEMLKSINSIVNTIYVILAICIIISFILVFMASSFFSRRIRTITSAMKQVEKGNFKIRIESDNSADEIQQISHSFNRMCERLSSYIDKEYLSEIRYKDAELTALQNQISPHFLYNTLEAIRMEAIINQDNDVSDMIYSLAYLFRTNLKNQDKFIKLKDEIEYIKAYLDIHKIRFKDRLIVHFNISEETLNYCIPKLALQPIIENSIFHGGLNTSMDALRITVSTVLNNGIIEICIKDNGVGIDEEELEKLIKRLTEASDIKNNVSIGLKNVNDRIKVIFGEAYGIKIESDKLYFTKVIITLPAKTIEEMNKNV